jgi:hypothetical protein
MSSLYVVWRRYKPFHAEQSATMIFKNHKIKCDFSKSNVLFEKAKLIFLLQKNHF